MHCCTFPMSGAPTARVVKRCPVALGGRVTLREGGEKLVPDLEGVSVKAPAGRLLNMYLPSLPVFTVPTPGTVMATLATGLPFTSSTQPDIWYVWGVGVLVGVRVGVLVAVGVLVGVRVGVLVAVRVLVGVRVGVLVAVGVLVEVRIGVGVRVWSGVGAASFVKMASAPQRPSCQYQFHFHVLPLIC